MQFCEMAARLQAPAVHQPIDHMVGVLTLVSRRDTILA